MKATKILPLMTILLLVAAACAPAAPTEAPPEAEAEEAGQQLGPVGAAHERAGSHLAKAHPPRLLLPGGKLLGRQVHVIAVSF